MRKALLPFILAVAATACAGGVDVAGMGAGAGTKSSREVLNEDGDDASCSKAKEGDKAPPYGCGAILRVELLPVGSARLTQPTCPERTRWDGIACVSEHPATPGGEGSPAAGGGGPGGRGGSFVPGAMARVPGATFMIGGHFGQNASPEHQVTVATFEIDVTEVTVSAFKACVDAGKCMPPRHDGYCNWGKDKTEQHPINCVDWHEAKTYCAWAGKRLPGEIEWEFASVGQTGWTYPWGNNQPDEKMYCKLYGGPDGVMTCPVGSFPTDRSRFGVLDLVGSVFEWTADNFCSYEPPSNPRVSNCSETARIVRGGMPSSARNPYEPPRKSTDLGFRCARTP